MHRPTQDFILLAVIQAKSFLEEAVQQGKIESERISHLLLTADSGKFVL